MRQQRYPLVVQVRPVDGGSVVFLLNTGEETIQREYAFGDFDLPESAYVWVCNGFVW